MRLEAAARWTGAAGPIGGGTPVLLSGIRGRHYFSFSFFPLHNLIRRRRQPLPLCPTIVPSSSLLSRLQLATYFSMETRVN